MAAGVIALACLPPYLVWRGVPSTQEYLAVVALVAPLAAALLLSRTGWLVASHVLSSIALAAVVIVLAPSSAHPALSAVPALAVVPLEALLSGSRRAVVAAVGAAGAAGLVLAGLGALDIPLHGTPWPVAIAILAVAIVALGHLAALAVARTRTEGARQVPACLSDGRVLQAVDDLVTWHDRNGHVLKASVGGAKLLGVAASALHGRGLFGRVHVADRPAFLKAISDAAASGRPVVVQFRLRIGDGSEEPAGERKAGVAGGDTMVWVEMRAHRIAPRLSEEQTSAEQASPERTSPERMSGEPEAYEVVAVTRDVSEHMRRAEELEIAKAEAERADALKGRFLATVSHELRTPLNAIIGFSEIIVADGMPALGAERCREYASIIRDSGQHLLDVVNTLLDMSKIETGNFDFMPEPFVVAPLVNGCCDLIGLKADQAGVQLAREIAPDLPEFAADRRACRQILINLLSNAVKFTPRGGRITVTVRRDRDRLLFVVSDTGIGIRAEDLPRVGDPFFQASASYDRPHEGTGLGLSVVRGLVHLHRGSLTLESAPGKGTSVTVSLPIDCRSGAARPDGTARIETLIKPSEPLALKTG